MTQDFLDDFTEACEREGIKCFVAVTTDGNWYKIRSNLSDLPPVQRKGETISRAQDFLDAAKMALEGPAT